MSNIAAWKKPYFLEFVNHAKMNSADGEHGNDIGGGGGGGGGGDGGGSGGGGQGAGEAHRLVSVGIGNSQSGRIDAESHDERPVNSAESSSDESGDDDERAPPKALADVACSSLEQKVQCIGAHVVCSLA